METIPYHDDVIEWKIFPRYWPFVRGIHWSPVNSPHKGQWRWALMFSLICAWTNGWVNNRDAGDVRHHRSHYDAIVMDTHHFILLCQAFNTRNPISTFSWLFEKSYQLQFRVIHEDTVEYKCMMIHTSLCKFKAIIVHRSLRESELMIIHRSWCKSKFMISHISPRDVMISTIEMISIKFIMMT